jgi:YVTN family beta-propeller protein
MFGAAAESAAAAQLYAVTATIPLSGVPNGVAVDSTIDTAYVIDPESDKVSVIDGASNTVTGTIAANGDPLGVAVDPTTDTAYVTNGDSGTVSVIDGAGNTVTATIAVGSSPNGVAVDPTTDTAYVTDLGSNTVSVIDGASNTVTATIPLGGGPYAVAVDPTADTAYVTDADSNTVSVIDGASNTVTATIPVGGYPDAVDVDPTTHTAYVANGTSHNVSVITPTPWPVVVTGSQTYGSLSSSFTTSTPPPSGESFSGTLTCKSVNDGTAIGPTLAAGGTYTIDGSSCSGLSLPDRNVTYTRSTFTVNQAPLTVNPPSASAQHGNVPTTFTPTYTGLVNGQSAPSTPATCTTTATDTSPPASYPITCSDAKDSNYDISYGPPGTLTINHVTTSVITVPPTATVLTLGNQKITLVTPSACTTAKGRLAVSIESTTIADSKARSAKFSRVAFYIDGGIKHVRKESVRTRAGKKKIVVTTYTPNATRGRVPVAIAFSLARLKAGSHTLNVVLSYTESIRKDDHQTKLTLTKTLKVKFKVC